MQIAKPQTGRSRPALVTEPGTSFRHSSYHTCTAEDLEFGLDLSESGNIFTSATFPAPMRCAAAPNNQSGVCSETAEPAARKLLVPVLQAGAFVKGANSVASPSLSAPAPSAALSMCLVACKLSSRAHQALVSNWGMHVKICKVSRSCLPVSFCSTDSVQGPCPALIRCGWWVG